MLTFCSLQLSTWQGMCWASCVYLRLLLQLLALLYYVASYFPGGTQGVKFVLMMATSAFKQCMYATRQAVMGK